MRYMSLHTSDTVVAEAQEAYIDARDKYGAIEKEVAQRYFHGGMAS